VDQMVIEKFKGEYFLPVELNRSAQQVIAKRDAVNMFPGLVHNGQLISGLLRTVEPCNNDVVNDRSPVRRSRTSSQFYLSNIPPQFGLLRRGKPSGLFEGATHISPYLAEFVCSSFFESRTDAGGMYTSLEKFTNLQLHSEMVSEDEMFRAHFNYRREGSWHDWVNVQRERIVTKGGVQTKVDFTNPGRVLLFVTYHGISFHLQQQDAQSKEQSGDDDSVDSDESSERKMRFYAVIIPSMENTVPQRVATSAITKQFRIETVRRQARGAACRVPNYEIIDCECMDGQCLVFPNKFGPSPNAAKDCCEDYHIVDPSNTWGSKFLSFSRLVQLKPPQAASRKRK